LVGKGRGQEERWLTQFYMCPRPTVLFQHRIGLDEANAAVANPIE